MSADARRLWLADIAPVRGGRREEVFDSIGVLFLLPTADILSMIALKLLKLEKLMLCKRVAFEKVSRVSGFSETKLQIWSMLFDHAAARGVCFAAGIKDLDQCVLI